VYSLSSSIHVVFRLTILFPRLAHQIEGISVYPIPLPKHQKTHPEGYLLLLATAKQSANSVTNTLAYTLETFSGALSTTNNSIRRAVQCTRTRCIFVDVAAIVTLALSLGSVDTLLGRQVADGLQKTALADLATGEVVDTIL
jgi:hypothetical protein